MNHSLFDTLNTETAAYILGFILGDGSVEDGSPRLRISSADLDIIEKIQSVFDGGTIRIAEPPKNKSHYKRIYILSVNSSQTVHNLLRYGIVSNKSKQDISDKLVYPEGIYFYHFLRGLLDSDGCITTLKHWGYVDYILYFCSGLANKKMLQDVAKLLYDKDCLHTKFSEHGRGFHISYTGYDLKHLLSLLYKGSNLYMDRKRGLAFEAFNNIPLNSFKRKYDSVLVRKEIKNGADTETLMNKFNFKYKQGTELIISREQGYEQAFSQIG